MDRWVGLGYPTLSNALSHTILSWHQLASLSLVCAAVDILTFKSQQWQRQRWLGMGMEMEMGLEPGLEDRDRERVWGRPAQMSAVQCLGSAGISKMQLLARNLFARRIRLRTQGLWALAGATAWKCAGQKKNEYALTICQVKSQIQPSDFPSPFLFSFLWIMQDVCLSYDFCPTSDFSFRFVSFPSASFPFFLSDFFLSSLCNIFAIWMDVPNVGAISCAAEKEIYITF